MWGLLLNGFQTHDRKDQSLIASALSTNCGDISICVWVQKNPPAKDPKLNEQAQPTNAFVYWVMLVITVLFLYQNLVPQDFRTGLNLRRSFYPDRKDGDEGQNTVMNKMFASKEMVTIVEGVLRAIAEREQEKRNDELMTLVTSKDDDVIYL